MDEFIAKEDTEKRKQKQDYLRKHILESNFDPEEFVSFISKERD